LRQITGDQDGKARGDTRNSTTDIYTLMNTFIALLAGINLGGHNRLPMAALKKTLEDVGLKDIQTYIQSGNVVFRSKRADTKELSKTISGAIGERHGFTPHVLILTANELNVALEANPFREAEANPKSLHLFFLEAIPKKPDLTALETFKKDSEHFALLDKVFYFHAPEGIGRSKLAAKDWGWGVKMTARNWRTVSTLRAMVEENI
jgi:uncharacterized protein (DUF1697 family)